MNITILGGGGFLGRKLAARPKFDLNRVLDLAHLVTTRALLGHGDRAYDYFRAYLPAAYNTRAEVRETEPYVYSQSTHSIFSPKFGVSRLPWLTGTVSWSYFAATQYILGIQPDYDGLRLAPCLPSAWNEITVTREFRGKHFDIIIRRVGKRRLIVNGEELAGDLIPAEKFRERNTVVCEI